MQHVALEAKKVPEQLGRIMDAYFEVIFWTKK
jgi:hypothetical protein